MLVDTRRQSSWDHGHIPGALHIPTADIPSRAAELIPGGMSVVVYSWGPGCNGSTFAALAFAQLGYPVRNDRRYRVLDPEWTPTRNTLRSRLRQARRPCHSAHGVTGRRPEPALRTAPPGTNGQGVGRTSMPFSCRGSRRGLSRPLRKLIRHLALRDDLAAQGLTEDLSAFPARSDAKGKPKRPTANVM